MPEPSIVKDVSIKSAPTAPTAPNKAKESFSGGMRRALLSLLSLSVLLGVVWLVWTKVLPVRKANVNVFDIVEPLYLSSDAKFEAGLKSVNEMLEQNLDEATPSSTAMRLFLSSQLPTGQGAGLISCPVRTEYPRPKTFHQIYMKGHCSDAFGCSAKQNCSDVSVAFVADFDLATHQPFGGDGQGQSCASAIKH